MHPRLIGLDGLTPLAHCHTWKLATATELRKEDKSTNIKPSLMVMAFVAPYAAPTKGTGILPFQLACLGYGMLSAGQYEFLPCFLHVLEDAQIRLEVIPCGGLDVGVSELPCDHADVGSGLDRQRAERVA